jgi:hypothetical protein
VIAEAIAACARNSFHLKLSHVSVEENAAYNAASSRTGAPAQMADANLKLDDHWRCAWHAPELGIIRKSILAVAPKAAATRHSAWLGCENKLQCCWHNIRLNLP